jgi:hypothetical protein
MSLLPILGRSFLVLVAAELAVLGVLAIVAWFALRPHPQGAGAPPPRTGTAPSVRAPRAGGWAGPIPTPPSSAGGPASSGPPPGLTTDPSFIAAQLGAANRDEAALERAEWNVTQALARGVRVYLDRVVLPAVERARRGSSTNP